MFRLPFSSCIFHLKALKHINIHHCMKFLFIQYIFYNFLESKDVEKKFVVIISELVDLEYGIFVVGMES